MPKPEFVLVPREPTEEMINHAWVNVTVYNPAAVYRAMISAAPPSPSVDEEMLEALKLARGYVERVHGTLKSAGVPYEKNLVTPDLSKIDAAITRATGGKE